MIFKYNDIHSCPDLSAGCPDIPSPCKTSGLETSYSEEFKMADVMQELCDYEKRRLQNVEKNIEHMKTLGITLLYGK